MNADYTLTSKNPVITIEILLRKIHQFVFNATYNKFADKDTEYRYLYSTLAKADTKTLEVITEDQPQLVELLFNELSLYSKMDENKVWENTCRLLILFIENVKGDIWRNSSLSALEVIEMIFSMPLLNTIDINNRESCCRLLRLILACFISIQNVTMQYLSRIIRISSAIIDIYSSASTENKTEASLTYSAYFQYSIHLLSNIANNPQSIATKSISQLFSSLQNINLVPIIRSLMIPTQYKQTLRFPIIIENILIIGDLLSHLCIEIPNTYNQSFSSSFYTEHVILLKHILIGFKEYSIDLQSATLQYMNNILATCMCPHQSARSSARSLLFSIINDSGVTRDKVANSALNAHILLLKKLDPQRRVLPRAQCPINEFTHLLQIATKNCKLPTIQSTVTTTIDSLYLSLKQSSEEQSQATSSRNVEQISSWLTNVKPQASKTSIILQDKPMNILKDNKSSNTGNKLDLGKKSLRQYFGDAKRSLSSNDNRPNKFHRFDDNEDGEPIDWSSRGESFIHDGIPFEEEEVEARVSTVRPIAPTSKKFSVFDLMKDSPAKEVNKEVVNKTSASNLSSLAMDILAAYNNAPASSEPISFDVPLDNLYAEVLAFSLLTLLDSAETRSGPQFEPVPLRFRDEDHYISIYSPMLIDELKSSLRSDLQTSGRRSESIVSIRLSCENVGFKSDEFSLSECLMAIPEVSNGSNINLSKGSLQKDDLVVIHTGDDGSFNRSLRSEHWLGVITSSLRKDPKDKYFAIASIVVQQGSLLVGTQYTCTVLSSLTTFLREWVAVQSVGSPQLMPLASYILKASPVVSPLYLNKLQSMLQTKIQSIPNLEKDIRNRDQLSRMHESIEADLREIRDLPVDGSVLKITGMGKYLSKFQKNEYASSTAIELCRDIVYEWKEQVKNDNKASTIKAFRGGRLVVPPRFLEAPEYIPRPLWDAFSSEYNQSQLLAVKYVCEPLSAMKDNRISLVQGPPGTGKTKTIIGIVSGLLQALSE